MLKLVTHQTILYADRGDRRKSPGVAGAAIAIFADHRDRAIFIRHPMEPKIKAEEPHCRDQRKNLPSMSAAIYGENRLVCRRLKNVQNGSVSGRVNVFKRLCYSFASQMEVS